ncbi:MAG: tRNA (adenosine(37)-N6)-dimethylallyltransferase MiaA [Candidatus Woesebacteria bacterium]|jgi:tRNA dimethylallyltransferase
MNKLLVICGPTAIGKTSLALSLANKFGAELVSADSRQVYKWMNIGTGKDLPKGAKLVIPDSTLGEKGIGYYETDSVKVWGYDLVEPTKNFSVSHYLECARLIIKGIYNKGKLPILVGGTGLYIKAVVDGIETAAIPRNKRLRDSLNSKGADELFEVLAGIDPTKAASMNASDRKNPRRLVRAIEIAEFSLRGKKVDQKPQKAAYDCLMIGLETSRKKLKERIRKRVKERFKKGILDETEMLFAKGVTWQHQAMNTLGYKQWRLYFEKAEGKESVLDKWVRDEFNYAKRQMVWFKKDDRIEWFPVDADDWKSKVEKRVHKWYTLD